MYRIGTTGWSIPRQHAAEFPATGTHLVRYSKTFNCAEINSCFYRSHRTSTWERWADSVPADFRFSVKAPKTITHEAQLSCPPEQLKNFLAEIRGLADKLGPILFQLPPKSAFNPKIAEAFFLAFRDLHPGPAVFEPRHPSWFTAEAADLLERFEIARVAADPTQIPEAAIPGGWSQLIYYRLHGSPRTYYSSYPETYLQSLSTNIAQSLKEIWCIFDNTASGEALGNAQTLRRLVKNKTTPKPSTTSRSAPYQSPPARAAP